jgi:hypothetical protein
MRQAAVAEKTAPDQLYIKFSPKKEGDFPSAFDYMAPGRHVKEKILFFT